MARTKSINVSQLVTSLKLFWRSQTYFENKRVWENGKWNYIFWHSISIVSFLPIFKVFCVFETVFWLLGTVFLVSLIVCVCVHFIVKRWDRRRGEGGCYNQLSLFWFHCLDPIIHESIFLWIKINSNYFKN